MDGGSPDPGDRPLRKEWASPPRAALGLLSVARPHEWHCRFKPGVFMHLAGVPRGLPDSDDLTSRHSLPGGGGDPSGLLAFVCAAMGAFVERAACSGHVGGADPGAGTSPER